MVFSGKTFKTVLLLFITGLLTIISCAGNTINTHSGSEADIGTPYLASSAINTPIPDGVPAHPSSDIWLDALAENGEVHAQSFQGSPCNPDAIG